MLAEANGLGYAVFGDGEVFGGEAGDEVSLLVFGDYGFHDQLRFDGESIGRRGGGGGILADLLLSRGKDNGGDK